MKFQGTPLKIKADEKKISTVDFNNIYKIKKLINRIFVNKLTKRIGYKRN